MKRLFSLRGVSHLAPYSDNCCCPASGRFLFAIDYLSKSESSDLRNMSDEYGVIPFPKLDEKQDSYYSYASDD